jgi:hypothetical protein
MKLTDTQNNKSTKRNRRPSKNKIAPCPMERSKFAGNKTLSRCYNTHVSGKKGHICVTTGGQIQL